MTESNPSMSNAATVFMTPTRSVDDLIDLSTSPRNKDLKSCRVELPRVPEIPRAMSAGNATHLLIDEPTTSDHLLITADDQDFAASLARVVTKSSCRVHLS